MTNLTMSGDECFGGIDVDDHVLKSLCFVSQWKPVIAKPDGQSKKRSDRSSQNPIIDDATMPQVKEMPGISNDPDDESQYQPVLRMAIKKWIVVADHAEQHGQGEVVIVS